MGRSIYAMFCDKVMMKGDATMSKLVAIGKCYPTFKAHQAALPSNWTTLYNLTRLSNDVISEKCISGDITPALTGSESLKMIGKSSELKVVKSTTISAMKTTTKVTEFVGMGVYISCESVEAAPLLKEIAELALRKGFVVQESADYQWYQDSDIESHAMEVM